MCCLSGRPLQVYVVQLPKSACLVFEVAPEVDVRRSMGIPGGAPAATSAAAASAAGSHGQRMQYHDIVRIWVSLMSLSGELACTYAGSSHGM